MLDGLDEGGETGSVDMDGNVLVAVGIEGQSSRL